MKAIKNILDFEDIHTHNKAAGNTAIINLDHTDNVPKKGYYSIGIHPWSTTSFKDNQSIKTAIETLMSKASMPNIVAIGECGIDKLHGADISLQLEVFKAQIRISESLHKPLIVHAVKSLENILSVKKEMKPEQRWILHGFRGKKEQVSQLIKHGIAISYGQFFNRESIKETPNDMMFFETDESPLSISEIKENILYSTLKNA